MILSTGLKKINESIKKEVDSKKQAKLFNTLEEKIANDKFLSHSFELLNEVNSVKNSLTSTEADAFIKKLVETHNKFISENSVKSLAINKSESTLLEFFNIDPKKLVMEKSDFIINGLKNTINESVVREIVVNKQLFEAKAYFAKKQNSLKESYTKILSNDINSDLREAIEKIAFRAKNIAEDKKKMVEASISTIKSESFKDFKSAVNKAYRLGVIVEKYLMEANHRVDVQLEDMEYIKDISAEIPKTTNEPVVFEFKVPIYPLNHYDSDNLVALPKVRSLLLKLERVFVNKFIYQKGRDNVIDPVGTKWDVSLSPNFTPAEKKNPVITKYAYFEIIMFPAEGATISLLTKAVINIISEFNDFLPTVDGLTDYLTQDVQAENYKSFDGKRKASYGDRSGADKYYNDLRTIGDDKWMDSSVFRGDARAEHEDEEMPKEDQEFVGDSQKNFVSNEEFDNADTDETIAKDIEAKMQKKQKGERDQNGKLKVQRTAQAA